MSLVSDNPATDLAQMAGHVVAGLDLAQRRRLHLAARFRIGAAGVEVAAGRRVQRARHVALHTRLVRLMAGSGTGTAASSASV